MQPTGEWILLGASRGLGQAFAKVLDRHNQKWVQYSRRSQLNMDFSKIEKWPQYLELILSSPANHLVYFAGGGPYGPYQNKNWQDHVWAWRVNFEFPAFLLHHLLNSKKSSIQQICLVGSAVAEDKADPGAASYSAAKHALRGLVKSVQAENANQGCDLRLFSPGYMDTPLLPANAWPRQSSGLVKDPKDVAEVLYAWLSQVDDANGHRLF